MAESLPVYDPNEPSRPQENDWDCSCESIEWCLFAWGRAPDDDWIENSMIAAGVVTPAQGCLDASGAGLARWLNTEYAEFGYVASNSDPVSFDDVAAEAATLQHPLAIGGRGWYHWSGVRGYDAAGDLILLANPAPGWQGVYQTLSRSDWDRLGGWSMVRLTHPAAEAAANAPAPEPPINGGIVANYPEGIDVSNNNGYVDWDRVAEAGCAFAIIKASEGLTFRDAYFKRNWDEAKRLGLDRGAYHFGRPSRCSGHQEATFFLAAIASLGCHLEPGDLLALDLEDPNVASGAALGDYTLDFCQTVYSQTGCRPLVYVSPSYVQNHQLALRPELGDYGLWLASWGVPTPPAAPAPWTVVAFHQYGVAAAGTTPGVSGECDRNRFNGPRESIKLYGLPDGTAPPQPEPGPEPLPPDPSGEFVVGSGILDAMTARGDSPASHEQFPNNDWSEAMGTSGSTYRWNKKNGRCSVYPAA